MEHCFTSLSAQSWQYRDRRKPEAGAMSYRYFERFFIRVLYSTHRQHCTIHAFEQLGALYMHKHDDKYPSRRGFEPGTSRLQARLESLWSLQFVVSCRFSFSFQIIFIYDPCNRVFRKQKWIIIELVSEQNKSANIVFCLQSSLGGQPAVHYGSSQRSSFGSQERSSRGSSQCLKLDLDRRCHGNASCWSIYPVTCSKFNYMYNLRTIPGIQFKQITIIAQKREIFICPMLD